VTPAQENIEEAKSEEKATVVERTDFKLNIKQTLIPIDIDAVLAQT
jgi:hypothetical protein